MRKIGIKFLLESLAYELGRQIGGICDFIFFYSVLLTFDRLNQSPFRESLT